MTFQTFTLPHHTDSRGWLVPCEFSALPFTPVRSYWLRGNKGETRGGHAHIIEQEIFICLQGSVTAVLEDQNGTHTVEMSTPNKGLFIPTMVWHEFTNFSKDAVLMALASTPYMPGAVNYITDRSAFRAQCENR